MVMSMAGNNPENTGLEEIAALAWRLMAHGAQDRQHGFHTPVLGTLGAEGTPQLRTVVLREANLDRLSLRAHCDRRSRKAAEILREPRVSLLFYDRNEKTQLRIAARASLHSGDDVARAAWKGTSLFGRRCYLQDPGPSAEVSRPTSGLPDELQQSEPTRSESEAGFRHFAVILARVTELDWLYLRHEGHRRARFTWDAEGRRKGCWLAP